MGATSRADKNFRINQQPDLLQTGSCHVLLFHNIDVQLTVPFLASIALSPEMADVVVLQYDILLLLLSLANRAVVENGFTKSICFDRYEFWIF